MSDVRDVIIIGSGPAGLTAAIYTARANLAPLVLEGEPSSTSDQPGGQLMLTTDVENFPGFPEGIMGPELMMNFRMQAERFGAEIQTMKASRVDLSSAPYGVWVGDPDAGEPTYHAHSLIIATGAQSIMLGLDRETELIGHGLSTCATCDGFFFRDHHIAVVGGGDSALEEANFLSRFAEKVTIIHRRDDLRASKIMQDRAFNNPKIEFLWDTVVTEYLGEQSLAGVKVENVKTGEISELPVTGMFIAIGHRPGTDLYKGQLAMKENGYLETVPGRTATDVAGVFAVGDVTDDYYRQAITRRRLGLPGCTRSRALPRGAARRLTLPHTGSGNSEQPQRVLSRGRRRQRRYRNHQCLGAANDPSASALRMKGAPPWQEPSPPSPTAPSTKPSPVMALLSSSTSGPNGVGRAK